MQSTRRDAVVRRLIAVVVLLVLAALYGLAAAQKGERSGATLEGGAARRLLSDRLWLLQVGSGESAVHHWTWKSDGSICVRFKAETKKCDDTGRWKLDGGRVCYELTWWGQGMGIKSSCFRIADRGEGHYEALEDNGMTQFRFTLAD